MSATAGRPPIPLAEVIAACAPEVLGPPCEATSFRWIERNSREVQPGDCFIAIRGERFDGHDFVNDAAARGATAALVRRDWAAAHPRAPITLLAVDEPVAALQRLAANRRDALGIAVVGITGSVGKTSAKEAVAAALGQRFRTYRSPGNMNSEIGLPLSLLEIQPDTEVAVLEMGGAYAFGELALLASIAKPRIAAVTNVHPVHLERMGSLEAIARTKSELVEAIEPDGTAVLNGDDRRVRAMAGVCRGRVMTFGREAGNDVRAEQVRTLGQRGVAFRLVVDGEAREVELPLVGEHAAELALVGIAVGRSLGLSVDEMLPGLAMPGVQIRLQLLPGPHGSRLIDDTYNASTPSVLSALGYLAEIEASRKIAVLGDMRELGPVTEREHRAVGRRVAEVADEVVTFGELARIVADEVNRIDGRTRRVTSFGIDERTTLTAYLHAELREGDVALLKGSRGLEMETIVRDLRAAAGATSQAE